MPPKRKKRISSPKSGSGPRKKAPAVLSGKTREAFSLINPGIDPSVWFFVLLGFFVVLWIACSAGHYPQAAKVFLVTAILIGASFFLKLNDIKRVLLLIGLGWALASLAIGANPNFSYAFSFIKNFSVPDPVVQFAVGMGLLIAFWRFLPPADHSQDISKGWARFWFWVIFAVAVYFRLYKVHDPAGVFWDDSSVGITDPRGIVEFHEHPLLMPIANREPFYSYWLAGLWALMPDAYAIFVQRLGCGLIDLIAVWLLYLLGKEVGGRRVGLVTAALGAVSKPMIIGTLICFTNVTVAMAVALVLLMTLRLFKNPNWKHFIYWGLALGFIPYTYTAVRPWPLFIVTAVFLWVWFYKNKRKKWDALLGWGGFLVWAFCFLMVNNFLPKQNVWVDFLEHGWVGILVLAGLLCLLYLSLRPVPVDRTPGSIPHFFIGILLAAILVYPLVTQPLFSAHPSNLSIFHNRNNLSLQIGPNPIRLLVEKVSDSLHTVFIGGEDRGDMNLPMDAFFDFHFIPIFVLGFVSLLVRPSWMKIFLLVAGLVGISPHVLSIDPHSGKLLGGVPPLAVLAAMGVQQVYSALRTSFPGKAVGYAAALLFVAYFGWAIWGVNARVLHTFFTGDRVEKTLSLQVKQLSGENRVFIAPYSLFVSSGVQAVLDQGYDVYALQPQNPIFLKPGETPKGVVVLMHIYDKPTRSKIEEQFKNVSWETIYLEGWPDKRPACLRAVIPASQIGDKPGKLFYFQHVPSTDWIRDYLIGRYIFTYGEIEMEESVPNLYDPIPRPMLGRMSNIKGGFELPAAGRVNFKVTTNDYVKFVVDGKKILQLEPKGLPLTDANTVDLAAGEHQVNYDIYLQHDQAVPQIFMSVNGGPPSALGQPTQDQAQLSKP